MNRARLLPAAFLALVVACSPAYSDPPEPTPVPSVSIDLGAPVTVEVGKKCVITATTDAKKVTWGLPAGVDAMPLDGKRLAVWALPGSYTFRAMAPAGDDVVVKEIVVTITGMVVGPVVDTLAAEIQKAYDSEPTSVLVNGAPRLKALDAVALAEAYRAHARALPTFATANDAASDLLTVRKAAVAERIPSVRLIAGKELAKILPSIAAAPLTEQHKRDAAAFLNKFAQLLDQVK